MDPIADFSKPPVRGWQRDPLVLAIAGIFVLFLGVNGVMLAFSLRQPLELVQGGYPDGVAKDDAAWQVTVLPEATRALMIFRLMDRQGHPLSGYSGTLAAYRPSATALDQALILREVPVASGRYEAAFTNPQPGLWKLNLDIGRDGQRLQRDFIWSAP